MRKCKIHLPLTYGNGEPIEPEKIKHVREELIAAFDSFAEIMKIEISTTGDKLTKKRLKDFKERLKASLQEIDILITTHGIQVI